MTSEQSVLLWELSLGQFFLKIKNSKEVTEGIGSQREEGEE